MKATSQATLLEVVGLEPAAIGLQSMQNLWIEGVDASAQKLARVEVLSAPLEHDALERLSWALLATRADSPLVLRDRRTGSEVMRVWPVTGAVRQSPATPRAWDDHWLASSTTADLRQQHDAPSTVAPARRRLRNLFALHEDALAIRERLWQKVHGLFGERIAVLAYRLVQRLVGFGRRLNARSCPIGPATLAALRSVPAAELVGGPGVALFTSRLSPGGAEKNALDLAVALARSGSRAHVFTTFGSENRWADRARSAGVRVVQLPEFLPRACWGDYLADTLQRHAVGLVHINNSHWLYEHLHALKARLPGLRVVSQLHAEGRPGMRDYLALAAAADSWIDHHSVISEFLRGRLLERYPINPDKVSVVRTGIDLGGEFDPLAYSRGAWRERHGLAEIVPLVAFIGRFSDIKRPMVFVEVARRVLTARSDVKFVMKGEGPLRAVVRRALSADSDLARAVILEDAGSPVQPLMVDADLLVLTSAMEGIAYVSYEAMALGLAQVSAAVGAQSELITPGAGVLVETGNGEVGRFADAVLSLLADPARRLAMADGARQRILQWPTVHDMAAAYRSLYQRLTGDTRWADRNEYIDPHRRGTA